MTRPNGLLSSHAGIVEVTAGWGVFLWDHSGKRDGHRKTQEENQTAVKAQSSRGSSTHHGHSAHPSVGKGTGRSWSEAHRNHNAPSTSQCKRSCMERLLEPRQPSGKFSFHVVSFVWVDLPLMVCPVVPPNLSSVSECLIPALIPSLLQCQEALSCCLLCSSLHHSLFNYNYPGILCIRKTFRFHEAANAGVKVSAGQELLWCLQQTQHKLAPKRFLSASWFTALSTPWATGCWLIQLYLLLLQH